MKFAEPRIYAYPKRVARRVVRQVCALLRQYDDRRWR
jgi:hypothetical protein